MSKIFRLFIDENIKTWKKTSTKILLIFIILALFGTLALTKFMQKINDNNESISSNYDWKEGLQEDINYYKEQITIGGLDETTRKEFEQLISTYELFLQYDVEPWNNTFWKAEIITQIANLQVNKTENDEANTEETIQNLTEILKNDDFAKYMEMQKQNVTKDYERGTITKQEYDDQMTILDLKAKYEIGKSSDEEYWRRTLLSSIEAMQKSIRTGIDQETNKVLTAESKQKYEDTIKMDIYRLEHNMAPTQNTENSRTVFELLAENFVMAVIAIAAIVIAGGEISTEVSNGTIKFWALTPNKRWKILLAKLLSVLFYILVITIIMALLSILCSNLFFTEPANEYIYVENGTIKTIANAPYTIEKYLVKAIPVVIFALFALMLSTITRNTAVSVSFSVATYMGNGMVMAILNTFIKKDWIRYIPFNNLNIVDKIFVNSPNPISITSSVSTFATSTSLEFSLAVLGVCAILMLVTMFDSFNHRDII